MVRWLVFLLLILYFYMFYRYCKSYKFLLSAIDPKYKRMEPNFSYLLLIPVFNIIWQVILLFHVKGALARLQTEKILVKNIDGGFYFGLAMVGSQVFFFVPDFQILGLASLVFWIICWAKVADAKNIISSKNY
jgi:hypothetical protein